jgi:hypothetical protein
VQFGIQGNAGYEVIALLSYGSLSLYMPGEAFETFTPQEIPQVLISIDPRAIVRPEGLLG